VDATVDTGCDVTVLHKDIADHLQLRLLPTNIRLSTANNDPLVVCGRVDVDLRFDNVAETFHIHAIIVENLCTQMLLGMSTLVQMGISIDLDSWTLRLPRSGPIALSNPRPRDKRLPALVVVQTNDSQEMDTTIGTALMDSECDIGTAGPVITDVSRTPKDVASTDASETGPRTRVSHLEASTYVMDPGDPRDAVSTDTGETDRLDGKAHERVAMMISSGTFTSRENDTPLVLGAVIVDEGSLDEPGGSEIASVVPKEIIAATTVVDFESDLKRVLEKAVGSVTEHERAVLEQLLREYCTVFATDTLRVSTTNAAEHHIELSDSTPIVVKYRRLPEAYRELIEKHIEAMIRNGQIERSNSKWAAPMVIVRKKDGTIRVCIDYRELNKVTVKDVSLIPNIDELLEHLEGATIFSSLDLASGYYQVPMALDSRDKTAFSTPNGLYEFKVMPFGLTGAPATFQSMMNRILGDYVNKFVLTYLDDVCIYSSTFEEHQKHIRLVFDRLRKANLQIRLSKCTFAQRELVYLGHVISGNGIKTNPEKVTAVSNFATPTTVTNIQEFLGMASYYRRFIENFSLIAEPMQRLLHKGTPFVWTEEQQHAFDTMKQRLVEAPILVYPRLDRPFIVKTDASNVGIGAVLSQLDDEGHERVIAYASRRLSSSELNRPTIEKECAAIVWSMKKWKAWLLGSQFKIYSDHKPLQWLLKSHHDNPKLQRWASTISEFGNVEITYKKGELNLDADALSRNPIESTGKVCVVRLADTDAVNDDPKEWILRYDDVGTEKQMPQPTKLDKDLIPVLARVQREDPELADYIAFLEDHTGATLKDWPINKSMRIAALTSTMTLINHVLYFIRPPSKNSAIRYCLVVPESLKDIVLTLSHERSGHMGASRTLARLYSKYYWIGMFTQGLNWVKSCNRCRNRKTQPSRDGPLKPIDMPEGPWQVIGMDVLKGFPKTPRENIGIIVITDLFTRYAVTVEIKKEDADTIAHAILNNIVLIYGAPRYILSDRGTPFTAEINKAMCTDLEIRRIFTSGYHPETNGLTERFNRTLCDILSFAVNKQQNDWDLYLPYATFAYNTSRQESIKQTPFFLMFGRQPYTFSERMLGTDHLDVVNFDDWRKQRISMMSEAFAVARENRETAAKKQAEQFNSKLKTKERTVYQPGDLVIIHKGQTSKLGPRWIGPRIVLKDDNNDNNTVVLIEPNGQEKVYNKSRLRLYTDRTISLTEITRPGREEWKRKKAQQPEQQPEDFEPMYQEIDTITDVRYHKNKLQYKIVRSGEQRDIWKDADKIDAPAAINDFYSKRLLVGDYREIPSEAIELEDKEDSTDHNDDEPMVVDVPEPEPMFVQDATEDQMDQASTSTTTTAIDIGQETVEQPATRATKVSRSGRHVSQPSRYRS